MCRSSFRIYELKIYFIFFLYYHLIFFFTYIYHYDTHLINFKSSYFFNYVTFFYLVDIRFDKNTYLIIPIYSFPFAFLSVFYKLWSKSLLNFVFPEAIDKSIQAYIKLCCLACLKLMTLSCIKWQ